MVKSLSYNHSSLGKAYALYLAIIPLILAYKFPGIEMGIATVLIAVGIFPAILVIIMKRRYVNMTLVGLLFLYLGYVTTKTEGNNFLLPIFILIHITVITTGIVDNVKLRYYLESISIIAAVVVIFQQIFHILLGGHIPAMIPSLLLKDIFDNYSTQVTTGFGIEKLYRPSAFFLEPAHFSQYVILGLGSSLYRKRPYYRKALILSLGLFATTSGMGFVLTFGIWAWWFITYKKKESHMTSVNIIVFVTILVLLLIILSQISFTASIIGRFAGGDSGEYNAINGRLFFWDSYFGDKSFGDLIYGYGESELEKGVYFTGFMKILYAYGIIGLTLFILFLLYLLLKTKDLARMYTIIYLSLLFLANLTGFISIIFNIGVIISLTPGLSKYKFVKITPITHKFC